MSVTPEMAAAALSEREAGARRDRERRADEVRARVLDVLRATLPAGTHAWLIGSLAWGGFDETSDVDVVLQGAPSGAATRVELRLVEATRRSVDLLSFEALPESFRARLEREGLRVDAG